jgi:hypothetical protein
MLPLRRPCLLAGLLLWPVASLKAQDAVDPDTAEDAALAQPSPAQPATLPPMPSTATDSPEPAATARALDSQGSRALAPVDEDASRKAPAEAEEHAKDNWGEDRVMNGHRFPFPQFVPSSFAVSAFGVYAGVESKQVPQYPVDATTGADSAKLISLNTLTARQGIDFSVRLASMLALTGDAYARARVGTNVDTLLGTGADYELGANGGVLLRLLRTKRFQLSARGQAGYHSGQKAGITSFYKSVRSIAEQEVARALNGTILTSTATAELGRVDAAMREAARGLIASSSGVTASAWATAAIALTSFMGVQGMVGYTFDRTTLTSNDFQTASQTSVALSQTVDYQQALVGAALDIGGAGKGIPLDLVLEYLALPLWLNSSGSGGSSQQSTMEQRVAAGLYYAGRTDLQLGVSAYTLLAQPPEVGAQGKISGKPTDLGGRFVFRYIW